jgi:hypothetical protein
MNLCTGIQQGISLIFCEFKVSASGREDSLNSCWFFTDLHSGLCKNPRGNQSYGKFELKIGN